jgi:hypothetical protein
LPFGPWQPKQTAALVWPFCTVPWSYGVAAGEFVSVNAATKAQVLTAIFLFDIVAFPHP